MSLSEFSTVQRARRFVSKVKLMSIPVPMQPYMDAAGAILRRETDLGPDEPGWSFPAPNGKRYICVNAADREERQRFTICHEIAHIVLGLPSDHEAKPWWSAKRPLGERLCDIFAAELLLPEQLFPALAEDSSVSLASVEALANRFSASTAATGSRFAAAITTPCAFVLSENGKVRYASRSKALIDANAWIAPRMAIPPGSVSQRTRAGEMAGRGQIDADIWFSNWERGGTLVEEVRHLPKWDQTLSLLRFESGEVPVLSHRRPSRRWEAEGPALSESTAEDDEYGLEELDGHLRWPTRRRRP